MTLRLVEKDNVATLPVGNLHDICSSLRAMADAIDEGKIGPDVVLLVTRSEGMVDYTALGENVCIAEALGLLDLAHARIVNGAWRE